MAGHIKVKQETGIEVNQARARFESALQGLLLQEERSDSETDSETEFSPKLSPTKALPVLSSTNTNHSSPSRPPRKRARKEIDLHDSGFHHTYVMRMFERSVDLAQFEDTSALYSICRAWMINQPHNSSLNIKPEPEELEPIEGEGATNQDDDPLDIICDGPPPVVKRLPPPQCWSQEVLARQDPRLPFNPLKGELNQVVVNENDSTPHHMLLQENVQRWQEIRHAWREASWNNDKRYQKSYNVLKEMFDRVQSGI